MTSRHCALIPLACGLALATLLASPRVGRLNLGPIPTPSVRWDQPHEGNLFDFLYARRAVQSGHGF